MKADKLVEHYFGEFSKYIKNLNLESYLELSILSKEFLNANPKFYLFYPKLFLTKEKIEDKLVDLLCIAGYLYYQSVILMDTIIDEKDNSKYPLAIVCQEESIKILTHIFGLNSNFWNLWNLRKFEFFKAVSLQNELIKKKNVSILEFETLSDFKSSFGKIAIDSIFTLQSNNDKKTYNLYINSHKYFSIGFQLLDDVNDFKIDKINNHFNFAVYELSKIVDFETYNNNEQVLHKLLFIKDVGQNLLRKAIEYFESAENEIKDLNNETWTNVIREMKSKVINQLKITNQYIEELRNNKQ